MSEYKKLKYYFDKKLGNLLAEKILPYFPQFKRKTFIREIDTTVQDQELKKRVEIIADALRHHLPDDFCKSLTILKKTLGPENQKETGMFTEGYWLMPVAFFVEKYGIDHFDESMAFIREVTKRNTGEYAIRPFLKRYPEATLAQMTKWSKHENFQVRRLASEGLRPRLPWAKRIDIFQNDPSPVFLILDHLKSDPSAYVRKSVANNLADFLKNNYKETINILKKWRKKR